MTSAYDAPPMRSSADPKMATAMAIGSLRMALYTLENALKVWVSDEDYEYILSDKEMGYTLKEVRQALHDCESALK